MPHANSCRFAFPRLAYPAASRRATAGAVVSGTCWANTFEPYVVRTPAVSNRSLTASRAPEPTPASGGVSVMKIPAALMPRPARRLRPAGAQPPEARDERAVRLGDGVEVPRVGDHPARVAELAQPRAEAHDLRDAAAGQIAQLALALDVRRDPQPPAERAEPRPGQPRAHLMAHLAAL